MAKADQVAARLKRDMGPVAKRLIGLLGQILEGASDADLDRVAYLENEILEALEAAGVDDVLSEAEREITEAAFEAAQAMGAAGFSPSAAQAIDAVANSHMDDIANLFGDAAADIRRIVVGRLVTGEGLEGMLEEAAEALDTTISRAQSAVFTATQAVSRSATVSLSEETLDDPVYLYVGPAGPGSIQKAKDEFSPDTKTRPFCERMVGRAYTLAVLAAEDNGQGLPVPSTLGGYNCRHMLVPMTREEAIEEGWEVKG